MEIPCPYCHGTRKFRHERPPNVSDKWWFNMVGQAYRCPLCKGMGIIDRPIGTLIVDTGLVFIKTLEKRVLVGCPDPICKKWVDATDAFSPRSRERAELSIAPEQKMAQIPQRKFESKCPDGHDISIEVEQGGRL